MISLNKSADDMVYPVFAHDTTGASAAARRGAATEEEELARRYRRWSQMETKKGILSTDYADFHRFNTTDVSLSHNPAWCLRNKIEIRSTKSETSTNDRNSKDRNRTNQWIYRCSPASTPGVEAKAARLQTGKPLRCTFRSFEFEALEFVSDFVTV
jgi:hypothetical protein